MPVGDRAGVLLKHMYMKMSLNVSMPPVSTMSARPLCNSSAARWTALNELAHAASMEGITCVAKITGKKMPPIEKTRIPNATYCEPQVASIGLTERAAREAGHAVKVGKFPFLGNSKATILGHHEGFIKVVADEKFGEILGVHIIGPFATEIISESVAALQLEATVDDLMSTVHAHPTVWEAMSDAVAAVRGLSINA